MTPNAIYEFEKRTDARTVYMLMNHEGVEVPNFPTVYVRGEYKGREYVTIRPPESEKQIARGFTDIISIKSKPVAGEKSRVVTFTGITTTLTEPHRGYGDTRNTDGNHAVLVRLSEDRKNIIIYIFFNQGNNSKQLLERWTANSLCLTVEPIPIGQEKSPPKHD